MTVEIMRVDFKPKSSGMLRFREAEIEVQVCPGRSSDSDPRSTLSSQIGLQIVKWYPELAEGPAKSTFEQFGLSIDTSIPVEGASIAAKASYSVSRERPKRRIIHGSLLGDTERIVN